MQYWLIKTEPGTYSWEDLLKDTQTSWTGVRNFQARNNLRNMKKGDLAFFYYSGKEKAIQGIVKIAKESYTDPTATDGDWSTVDIVPVKELKNPVSLQDIKKIKALADMVLIKNSRLSVQPVTTQQWNDCINLYAN